MEKRLKKKLMSFFKTKPYAEWRLPIMLLMVSSMVFILITAGFGVQINTMTGELMYEMDWSKYIDEETGAYDPWVYDPFAVWMQGNGKWVVFFSFIGGFYTALIGFFYFWFKYMRWKWKNIPQEERNVLKPKVEYIKVTKLKRR